MVAAAAGGLTPTGPPPGTGTRGRVAACGDNTDRVAAGPAGLGVPWGAAGWGAGPARPPPPQPDLPVSPQPRGAVADPRPRRQRPPRGAAGGLPPPGAPQREAGGSRGAAGSRAWASDSTGWGCPPPSAAAGEGGVIYLAASAPSVRRGWRAQALPCQQQRKPQINLHRPFLPAERSPRRRFGAGGERRAGGAGYRRGWLAMHGNAGLQRAGRLNGGWQQQQRGGGGESSTGMNCGSAEVL